MSQCSCTNSYNVHWEMVKSCVKWMHTADTSRRSAFAYGNLGGDSRDGEQRRRSGSRCAVQSFVKKCKIQCNLSMRWMEKWLNTVIFNPFKILSLCISSLNTLIFHSTHLPTDQADHNHSKLFPRLLSYSAVLNEIQPYSP